MIAKNKCQCYEQANESLLKKISLLRRNKNECQKQISMVRKCKLMIAQNRHSM